MQELELTRYVELYKNTVYHIALCYTKNHADAEDITQEAFLKLYVSEKTFGGDEHVKAWLINVTANSCKNLLKSGWRRFSEPLENAESVTAEQKESAPELMPLLMKLKPETRTVMYMYYYEEYSVKEIAEILRKTQSVVTSRLSRGRKQLKRLLTEEGYADELQGYV